MQNRNWQKMQFRKCLHHGINSRAGQLLDTR